MAVKSRRRKPAATQKPTGNAAFGARVREAREALGLSRYELAARIGVTFQAVYNWEAGLRIPSYYRIRPLAAALGIAVNNLFPRSRN